MTPRRAGPPRLAPVHRNTVLSVLGSFGAQAAVLVSGVLVARILGVESRGFLALLWLVSLIFAQLGTLGLPLAITYWIAKEPRAARSIVRSLRGPLLIQAPVLVGFQALVLWALVGDEGDSVGLAALFTLPLIPALLAHQYGLAILQGRQRFGALNAFRLFPNAVYAVAVAVLFAADGGDLPTVALAFSLILALTAGLTFGYAIRTLPRGDEPAPPLREMVRFGLTGLFGSISPLDNFQVDQAVVGLFLSPAALGLYVVAVAFTNLPRFIATSVGYVAFPHVAEHADPGAARRAMWKFAALALALCGSIVIGLEAAAGRLVPFFFGDEFSAATELARILLLSSALVGVRRVLADGARGAGYPAAGSLAEIAAWATLVPALAILAPAAEAEGVAWAMVISALLGLSTLLVAVLRSGRAPRDADAPAHAHLADELSP